MTPQEKKRLEQFDQELSQPVRLRLLATDDSRTQEIQSFAEELAKTVNLVEIDTEKEKTGQPPVLFVGENLRFQCAPLGSELEPFLDALMMYSGQKTFLSPEIMEKVSRIELPAAWKIYISTHCPHCPKTLNNLIPVVLGGNKIEMTVIDAMMFHESAGKDEIKSVPTLLLEERFRWVGQVDLDELLKMTRDRDPALFSLSTLEKMVAEGQAEQLARMMIEKKSVFDNYIKLLINENLQVRLGAMVALEIIQEADPGLAASVIDPLWNEYPRVNEQVKGDIVHMIGEVGSEKEILRLEKIREETQNPELREAAEEALEKIENR
jgi:glutaredoxin